MALQQLLCGLTVAILLFTQGCHSQLKDCGITSRGGKIIGGENTSAESWPWQVSLTSVGVHFCGGSLINMHWVLTAAHCMGGRTDALAVLGQTNQSDPSSGKKIVDIVEVKCHPNYNKETYENDICLLRLRAPVNFTSTISPVCLPTKNSTFSPGTYSWVTGWGDLAPGGPQPDTLQEVMVKIVGNMQCQCSYTENITKQMICAGDKSGGKDSCQGDSGGPMVTNGTRWVQNGVVSFGDGCGKPNVPGVYTRVSEYQMWISNITGMNMSDFVDFKSPGMNMSYNFSCPNATMPPHNMTTHMPPNMTTYMPHNMTTHMPPNMTTYMPHNMTTHMPPNMTSHMPPPMTSHMTPPMTTKDDDKDDGSIFGGAESLIHLASVGLTLALSLLVTAAA